MNRLPGCALHQAQGFSDAFFFSLQTIATIGYGRLSPDCQAADVIVLLESICGVLFLSILTGLVYSRFSRLPTRILFSGELPHLSLPFSIPPEWQCLHCAQG